MSQLGSERSSEQQSRQHHVHRRLLASYLREERTRAVGLAIMLLASQLVPLAEPLLLKGFVDQATAGAALEVLVGIALAYIAVALVAQVLAVVVSRAGKSGSPGSTTCARTAAARTRCDSDAIARDSMLDTPEYVR